MTNEQKYKTVDERKKAFFEFCKKQQCAECRFKKLGHTIAECPLHWLAAEYEEPKQDLPFIVKTEVRNGCEFLTICSFDGKEVIRCLDVISCKEYCDSLNAATLAWHKRMNEKEGK